MAFLLKFKWVIIYALVGLMIFVSCKISTDTKTKDKHEIMVFAAASLTNVINEIVDAFETKYKINVKINLASSGTLARQIEQGGKPDIYLSANKRWAEYIDSLGFVNENSLQQIAANSLVMIVPINSKTDTIIIDSLNNFNELLGEGRLSIGDPKHVPAGKYAKQALEYFNIYNNIEKQILPTKDVRTALMLVEMNEVSVGIVYKTDAKSSNKVKVIGDFPGQSHKPISYVAAACNNKEATTLFYEFLNSDEAKIIWTNFGFVK